MGATLQTARERLRVLPATFTYAQARKAARLTDRHLSALRTEGLIDPVSRGLYRRMDLPTQAGAGVPEAGLDPADIDLLEIARRAADATLCLTTALARHDLTDAIPAAIDVALPRGRHRPTTRAPVTWHSFNPATFAIGREELRLESVTTIGVYSAERSIIDVFRLGHLEGEDVAVEALKRWLRRRDSSPSSLLDMARAFPKAQRSLRHALRILL
jgi:predicted transcriptional regulator of viral defense system